MGKIAILGRPNVGKSTLFNRLLNQHRAITHNIPGVTRDNLLGRFAIEESYFSVLDTPGFITKSSLEAKQLSKAITDAELIIFLLEPEIHTDDFHLASWLRKSTNTQVLAVVNKCDKKSVSSSEVYELGLGVPLSISAEHNIGIRTLLNRVYTALEGGDKEADFSPPNMKIAIIGRPNVGKSTFVNNILAEDRILTSPEAGTTRDSVDVDFSYKGNHYTLVDTPGIRKRAKVTEALEIKSVRSSLASITRADLIIFMFDGRYGLEKQDYILINKAIDMGKATLLLANKWDLVEEKEQILKNITYQCEKALPFGIPLCTFSALNDTKYGWIIEKCLKLHQMAGMQIKTSKLNVWLEGAVKHHSPGLSKTSKRPIKLKYIVQISTHPLRFFISSNTPEALQRTYITYLVNDLRKTFGLYGVPVSLIFRRSHNPHAPTAS